MSSPPPKKPHRAHTHTNTARTHTLAPQPPLLEAKDADLGEDIHQVAIAKPAVLAGAVAPPAGRGPVPVLLARLALLPDQTAGDGRSHGRLWRALGPRASGEAGAGRSSAPAAAAHGPRATPPLTTCNSSGVGPSARHSRRQQAAPPAAAAALRASSAPPAAPPRLMPWLLSPPLSLRPPPPRPPRQGCRRVAPKAASGERALRLRRGSLNHGPPVPP